MVQVIMGLKGSGKTKQLVKDINEAVQSETGSVVCVEFGKKLTYDIDYRVRLIDAKEYNITNVPLLKGFLSGLHAGNFDITHVFIESLYKIIGEDRATGEAFVTCAKNSAQPTTCALPSPFPTSQRRLLRQ